MDSDIAFAKAWIEAWNARDLDAILAHYADDVLLVSPVARVQGFAADGILRGKVALRNYFAKGLGQAASLRFELVDLLRGVDGLTILYRREDGRLVGERVHRDEDGLIREASVHYGRPVRT